MSRTFRLDCRQKHKYRIAQTAILVLLKMQLDREQLEDYFYQALEVELLLRLCPDDEDTIYQIVDLLVDTCSTKRKMLRIAGDDKPTEVVRSRLKKLNADHIRFVLGCLAENTSPVRNMKQYLLAALFNAPTTMNLYYQNKTNHDFARGSPGR